MIPFSAACSRQDFYSPRTANEPSLRAHVIVVVEPRAAHVRSSAADGTALSARNHFGFPMVDCHFVFLPSSPPQRESVLLLWRNKEDASQRGAYAVGSIVPRWNDAVGCPQAAQPTARRCRVTALSAPRRKPRWGFRESARPPQAGITARLRVVNQCALQEKKRARSARKEIRNAPRSPLSCVRKVI